MDRIRTYALLTNELERWRASSWEHVQSHIGRPADSKTEILENEAIQVETRVEWTDSRHISVRVIATADGSSGWRLERLEEAIVIATPIGSAA